MSSRENWFYGDGILSSQLEEFCYPERIEALDDAISSNDLSLPTPLGCFFDDVEGPAIVVYPYQIDPLGSPDCLKDIRFFTKLELAKMIYEGLAETYFDVEGIQGHLQEINECSYTMDDVKQHIIQTIADAFEYQELCVCG